MLSAKIRRGLIVIPVSVTGLALVAGSVAWACTFTGGKTVLSPNSGARGSTFTATADNISPGPYSLAWLDSNSVVVGSRVCHHSTEIVGEGVADLKRNATGVGTVPLTAPDGPAQVCFSRAHAGDNSEPGTFTVVGGPGPVG